MTKKTTPTKEELPVLRPRSREAAHAEVQRELFAEMGSAFARANEKVERAIAELDRRGRALARARAAVGREERAALVARFNEQREVARVALWELRVHREALGIRSHRDIDETWKLPPRQELDED